MSQASLILPTTSPVSGLAMTQYTNAALMALATQNAGAVEPTPAYAYMLWADTTTGLIKQRNGANSAWAVIGVLGASPGQIVSKSAAYSLSLTDYGAIVGCSGTWNFSLPNISATNFYNGFQVTIWNKGSGVITLSVTGDTINGLSTMALGAGRSVALISDGVSEWNAFATPVADAAGRAAWNSKPAFRGCLVTNSAHVRIPGKSLTVPFDHQVYDTDNIYDPAAPTMLKVPAGASKVKVSCQLTTSWAAPGNKQIWFSGNFWTPGDTFLEYYTDGNFGFTQTISSPTVDVTPGKYATVDIWCEFPDQIVTSNSYFAMEIIE